MTTSDVITELAAALSKAQAEMRGASKDAENPHFRSKYADLASVWDACRGPLTKHGLSVLQSPRFTALGETWVVEVETRLLHSSGQWMADTISVPVSKVDAQGVGSAVTYARRYALAAFAGVAPEDDDANAAVGPARGREQSAPKPPAAPAGFDDWLLDFAAVAENGTAALRDAWTASRKDYREHLNATKPDRFNLLKEVADKVTRAAEKAKAAK